MEKLVKTLSNIEFKPETVKSENSDSMGKKCKKNQKKNSKESEIELYENKQVKV